MLFNHAWNILVHKIKLLIIQKTLLQIIKQKRKVSQDEF